MNKRDKVEKKVEDRYGTAFRLVVQAELGAALGTIRTDVEVLPCSVVKNRRKTELVDAVIMQLLKDLAK